jgi:hypothetical protein
MQIGVLLLQNLYIDGGRAGKRRIPKKLNRTRRRRAQVRHGVHVANAKAVTAARFYLNEIANKERVTLAEAALRHGTSVRYVEAAVLLLMSGDQRLLDRVEHGRVSLLPVARLLKPVIRLAEALANATSTQRTAAARAFGHPDLLWDDMVEPQLSAAQ